MQYCFCIGAKHAGVITITYVLNGRIIIETLKTLPKIARVPIIERIDCHA